jgi:hypothetical protein
MIQHFAERGGTTVLVSQPEPENGAEPAGAIHGLGKQTLHASTALSNKFLHLSW